MDIQEYTIKVLIIGDPTVGKTSVVQRYTRNFFSHRYKTTIGVDFDLKVLQWSETEMLKLHLWDIAGQEFHTKLTRVYYKSASACVILFDVTKQQTFKNSLLWKQDLDENVTLSDGHPVPCILFANKCDLPSWAVSKEEVNEFIRKNGFIGWLETSAKENKNITEGMRLLVEKVMDKGDVMSPVQSQGSNINLSHPPLQAHPSPKCC